MKLTRLFPLFSAAFAVIYAPTLYYNWALMTISRLSVNGISGRS